MGLFENQLIFRVLLKHYETCNTFSSKIANFSDPCVTKKFDCSKNSFEHVEFCIEEEVWLELFSVTIFLRLNQTL